MTGLRERNKSRRRSAILDATLSLLRAHEFADITVDQVAALAEVSPHTVYNLVGTRDDLIYTLMGRILRQMTNSADLSDSSAEDPSECLRATTDHGVDALIADPDAHRSVVRAVSSLPHWPGDGREPFQIFQRGAVLLEARGVLRPSVTPRQVARHATFGMTGAMLAWSRGRTDRRFRDDAQLNLSLVIAGMTTGAVAARAMQDVIEIGRRDSASQNA